MLAERIGVFPMRVSTIACDKLPACLLFTLLCSCPALAQTASTHSSAASSSSSSVGEPELQEIVVTADRREEQLGRVPMSVSAFTQDQMDAQGVKRMDDIALLTPGLTFTHGAGGNGASGELTEISIRGIQSAVGAGTTGVYIDDTPIQTRALGTSSSNVYPEVFDLMRVEVLRGPQGTLFGAGAEGGVVRFITIAPSLTRYSGYARSEVAVTDSGAPSYEFGLADGGPIIENELGFRASGWFRRDGGWVDRVDPLTLQTIQSNANSQDSATLRLAMTWAPTARLKLTPSVFYQNLQYNDSSLYWDSLSDPGDEQFLNGRALRQPSKDVFVLPALAVEYDFGPVSLLNNTSFFNRHATGIKDYTNWIRSELRLSAMPTLPGENAPVTLDDTQNVFTEELRLRSNGDHRVSWTAGVFFSHAKQFTYENFIDRYLDQTLMNLTAGAPFCPAVGCNTKQFFGVPLVGGTSYFVGSGDTLDRQIAAFGQADFQIAGGLKLTAGLRVADMKYTNTALTEGPLAGGTNLSGGNQEEHPVTPKAGVEYQVSPDVLFYGSATKGFRPGGSNIIVSTSCGADLTELGLKQVPTSYDSDNVWSYELGNKSKLAGGRFQLSSSLFWIDWSRIQQNVALPSCGAAFVGNLGAAVSKGFDLQARIQPFAGFAIEASGGYTDAEYSKTTMGGSGAIIAEKGDPIGIPKWSGSLSGEYDFTSFGRNLYARADFQFIGQGPGQDPRVYGFDSTIIPTGETRMLNLRLGTYLDQWNLSVFADNVTNDEPVLSRGHDTVTSPIFTTYTYRPRTLGVTAALKF
jgi:outer membrane receptor protein involved in Fe transport